MTVCIAGMCLHEGVPRIILCSDSRVSSNTFLTDSALKMEVLGHNWVALQAGLWPSKLPEKVGAAFRESIQGGSPRNSETMASAVRVGIAEFKASPLYLASGPYDLLITGFEPDDTPVILRVSCYEGATTDLWPCEPYASIGNGEMVANALLHQRKLDSRERMERALYLVYEAKKFSESVDGVGQFTLIGVQKPNPNCQSNQVDVRNINPSGIDVLDTGFAQFGLQKVPSPLPPFPDAMFFPEDR